MRKIIPFFVALALFAACQQTEDEKAAPLMNTIDSLYKAGNYQATLNAITRLRAQHPKAIESREKALKIWQDASLKMAQQDVGRTDSALQATIRHAMRRSAAPCSSSIASRRRNKILLMITASETE